MTKWTDRFNTGLFAGIILAAAAYWAWNTPEFIPLAHAQAVPAVTAGGMTREVCVTPVVTASAAYTSGNEVGGLITLSPAFRASAQGAPDFGGIVQSIRLTSKSVQTAPFNAYQFTANPSNSTWTDKSTAAINVLDVPKVRPPIIFNTASSGLGTHTVYGADLVGRAHVGASQADYWVLTVTGTPTFTATSDLQFCVTYLLD